MGLTLEEGERILQGYGKREEKPVERKVESKPVTVNVEDLFQEKQSGVTLEDAQGILEGKKEDVGVTLSDGQKIIEGGSVETKAKPKQKSDEPTKRFENFSERLVEMDLRLDKLLGEGNLQ